MTNNKSWPEDKIEQLRKLWVEDGKTGAEIASIMGVSRSNILGRVSRYGFKKEIVPKTKKEKPPKRVWRPWLDQAHALRREGLSVPEIAKRVGASKSSVGKACRGVPCPVNHAAIAGRTNFLRHVQEKKEHAALHPRERKKYVRNHRPKVDPVQVHVDRVRGKIRAAIGRADATREIPAITLPKLRFLEAA